MATIPSQATAAVGGRLTADQWNDDVRDAVDFYLSSIPRCQVYNSANISVATSTDTLLTFNSETYDVDDLHSTSSNTSRVHFNNTGLWDIKFYVRFGANSSGYRQMQLRLNSGGSSAGGSVIKTVNQAATSGNTCVLHVGVERLMTAGDYCEAFAWQNSGSTLNAETGNNVTGITVRWLSSS